MLNRAAIIAFIVCGMIFAFSPALRAEADSVRLGGYEVEYDDFFQEDTDGNEYTDKSSYYYQGYLALTAWDTSGDGQDDLWFRYDGQDYLDLEAADLDFDNTPDQFTRISQDETAYVTVSNPIIFLWLKIFIAALIFLFVILFIFLIKRKRQAKYKFKGAEMTIIILTASLLFNSVVCPYALAQDIFNEDGSINKTVFEQDWQKYSDIDDRIPLQSRSYEAQQYAAALARIAEAKVELYVLKQEMEIDRLQRIQLREYKQALVANIKDNLIKAMIRLSYVTYTTIKAGKGMSENYRKLFSGSVGTIEKIGSGLKVITGLQPQPNSPATIGSAAESMGKTGALEYLDTLGDPKKTGKAVFDEAVKQAQGLAGLGPDITPEEVAILKEQHLKNREIDKVLEQSYKLNRERRLRIEELEKLTTDLEKELARWEQEEKQRVWDALSGSKPDNTDNSVAETTDTGSSQSENTVLYNTTAAGVFIAENAVPGETILENRIVLYYPSQGGPLNGEGHVKMNVVFNDHTENVIIGLDFEGNCSPEAVEMSGNVHFTFDVTYIYPNGTRQTQHETDTGAWSAQINGDTVEGYMEESQKFQFSGPFKLTIQR